MPRVKALTPDQKIREQHRIASEQCKRLMRLNGIKQKDLARKTGLTQSAISYQLKGCISLPLLIAIVSMANAEPEELKKMIEIGGL